MKVAVIGAGALGAVYGVFLSSEVDVVWVVRNARPDGVLRLHDDRAAQATFLTSVPGDADVVLVAVGTENLGELELPDRPVVVLTPMLPHDWEKIRARCAAHATLVNVVAYAREDRRFRYWLLPVATQIDESRDQAVHELADALTRSGIKTRFELGIHEKNPATTVCFIPLMMTLALAGSFDALVRDEGLLALARAACSEGTRLGARIGKIEPFFGFSPVLATPWAFRIFAAALPAEWRFYTEEHFARKLVPQHVQMAKDMVTLCDEKGLPRAALRDLADRLAQLL